MAKRRAGAEPSLQAEIAAAIKALIKDMAALRGAELEQRTRQITSLSKAAQVLGEIETREQTMGRDDEQLDAAAEQRLREDLLGRLDALAAALGPEGHAGGDGPGSTGTASG